MALPLERTGNVTVISLSGKLGTEAAQELKDELYGHCRSNDGVVLIDTSRVTFVSSFLIGVLVGCHKLLRASGGELHLAGVDSKLAAVLHVSGLTELFPRHESREAGIASLSSRA